MDKQLERLDAFRKLAAVDVMTSPVMTVHMTDSVRRVAKLFVENNISGAPVLDRVGLPIGVVTKTDLATYDNRRVDVAIRAGPRRGFHIEEDEEQLIQEWMTPFICSVSRTDSVSHVARQMVKYGIHHVFVADKDTHFIEGVVTSFDILEAISRALGPATEGGSK